MRNKVGLASGIAVAATMLTAVFSVQGSGALAEEMIPAIIQPEIAPTFVSEPVVQEIPDQPLPADASAEADEAPQALTAQTLAAHVEAQGTPGEIDAQMRCLAGAVYFEARGESLKGQLAVARVIIERARSGRFPDSYCGVVYQRSQFSFVRGNRMPKIRTQSRAWRRALAVAQIADEGSWDSPVEGALFFHAVRVSPGWRLKRLARVDNHIFYR